MPCLLIKRKRKIILLTKQVQQGLNLLAIKKLKDNGACCFEMCGASDIKVHLDQKAQEGLRFSLQPECISMLIRVCQYHG